MAVCFYCGKRYDKARAEEIYDNDSYVIENDLEGTYGNFLNSCARCTLKQLYSAYPQGLEDLSYRTDY